jgi:very-short-patch-repair endonuclease
MRFGIGGQGIKRRLRSGRLHPSPWRGVYAVGRPELTRLGRWMAAVLACGPGATLSHSSAAALDGIAPERLGEIEISVLANRQPGRDGIRIHRRASMQTTTRNGIPLTSPTQTLLDLATRLGPRHLESAVNNADNRDLVDPERLRNEIEALGGPGVRPLRRLLDEATFTLTDTELERYFLPIARRAGLPKPLTQQHLNGHRVDFYFPALKLVVETDGLRYHRTPTQQVRDRKRDQAHMRAGLTPLRFTHFQVRYEPDDVEAILVAVAA